MVVEAMETLAAVKKSGSAELLGAASNWEDALLHWVNGVRSKLEINSAPCSLNRHYSVFRL